MQSDMGVVLVEVLNLDAEIRCCVRALAAMRCCAVGPQFDWNASSRTALLNHLSFLGARREEQFGRLNRLIASTGSREPASLTRAP